MSRSLPLAFPEPEARMPNRGAHRDALALRVAGEDVELLAQRALHWPREHMVFVADVHLGKAASFRASGVPVPRGATATDLERLSRIVQRTAARHLVVLGDFLHAAAGRVPALDSAFSAWRRAHASLEITLVRGNHDAKAGDPAPEWGIEVVAEPHHAAPFVLCHAPCEPATGYALCGHVHPGIRLEGRGFDSARLPCFVLRPRCALLPAFGRFTGLAPVRRSPEAQIIAIAGDALFEVPAA